MNQIAPATANPPQGAAFVVPVLSLAPGGHLDASVTQGSSPVSSKTAVAQTKASPEEIKQAGDMLQQQVNKLAPELTFSMDESSGRSIMKFTDPATQKIVWQFPSEDALHLTQIMDQFQKGLIVSRKA